MALRLLVAPTVLLLCLPSLGSEPGWHYSPLAGEGDRATLGCDREATPDSFTCLAVRCEDDFSTGLYIHSSRSNDTGTWEITLDRENHSFTAETTDTPYGGRIVEKSDWLLERLREGTFIYLRHVGDEGGFAFISLAGSLYAINSALSWCAPRVPENEPIGKPGVNPLTRMETHHGPSPTRTQ